MTLKHEGTQTANSTHARCPKSFIGVTGPEVGLQSVRDEADPSLQGQIPKDDIRLYVADHTEAGNCPKHCMRKTSSAQKSDKAAKVPAEMGIVTTKVAVRTTFYYVQLSKVRTTINQIFMEPRRKEIRENLR